MENKYRRTKTTVGLINYHLYSAYLIKNVNDDLKSINNNSCIKDFNKFLGLHDKEIIRLRGLNNLSSMGI